MRTIATLAFVLMAAAASAQTTTLKTTPPADVAAPPADAVKTPSGLASRVITPGTGKVHPTKADRVTVHYTGWTADGKMFDSSIPRREPATLLLTQLIAGWTEGLQLMVAGETRRLWIPEPLGYKGMGMIVFDVELIKIQTQLLAR